MNISDLIINLKKDAVVIKISDNLKQEEIVKILKDKLPELKNLYKDEKIPIEVTGKVLKSNEMDEIQKLIKKEIDVKINFDLPKTLGLHGIRKTFSKEINESQTKYIKHSLRNGTKIEYEGSVVVLGNVNSGAEITAEDNIVIRGTLRGIAHAGAKGNKKAIIVADSIDSPQIRIANVIKELEVSPGNDPKIIKNYIYVNDKDEIVID